VALLPQFASRWIEGTYSVDFDWTLETAGKRSKRVLVALAQAETAAAEVVDATWKVRAAVRKAYVEVYAAEQRVKLANEAIAQQEELLKAYNDRVKAGAESRSITQQARLLQAQMKLQAAESAKLASVARASLAEALALSVHGLEGATFSFTNFESPPHPAASRRNALTRRADVLAALADYAAAEANLRLEVAKQYPDIHLNPGYALDSGVNKWALGVGLTLPVLNRNEGPIGEAEAKRKQAAAVFESVQAKVLAECDRAAATLAAAQKKLATTDALLAEQGQQVAEDERLLKAGSGDRTGLLSAKVERAITQASRVDALAEVHAAIGSLEEATQTPLFE
jgi:outer membrane protein TolC